MTIAEFANTEKQKPTFLCSIFCFSILFLHSLFISDFGEREQKSKISNLGEQTERSDGLLFAGKAKRILEMMPKVNILLRLANAVLQFCSKKTLDPQNVWLIAYLFLRSRS